MLSRILEPFYTTKPDGTGLGLAISAGLVRDLGGELTAANHPGGGAVFRISLRALPVRSAGDGGTLPARMEGVERVPQASGRRRNAAAESGPPRRPDGV